MRSLILLAVSLATTSAFAFPTVGDEAKFTVTKVGANVNLAGTFEKLILSTDGNNFVVQTTVAWNGLAPTISQKTIAKENMVTDQQLSKLLGECSQGGGTLGSLVLNGQNLQTCAIPATDDDGNVIVGGEYTVSLVPFGLTNEVMPADDNTVITLNLESYVMGK